MDEGHLIRLGEMRRRIALKFCGGCDPGFDRVEYFTRIRVAAGYFIEWVTLDDGDFEAVLVISGCEAGCPEERIEFESARILSVRDDKRNPDAIARHLLSEVKP